MRTALFIPCYVEHFRPEVGLATVKLLEQLGLDWHYPDDQTCCGQPALNAGHPGEALAAARHWLRRFESAERIVSPSGSCVAMIRRYPGLPGLDDSEREACAEIGALTHELSDFLVNVLDAPPLGARLPLRAAFQDSCLTLRELGLAEGARTLPRPGRCAPGRLA